MFPLSGGRGHGYTYGWFLLMYDRKPQSPVKQLSFNLKFKKNCFHKKEIWFKKWYYVLKHHLMYDTNCIIGDLSVRSFAQLCMTLWPNGLQHARPPCPSPTPGIYSNVCPPSLSMPSNHLILCHPLLLLPSFFPSIRVFSNESVLCIRWPKYWSFSFSISPSNGYSGLTSFRID